DPMDDRSTLYCTDVAKMIDAPIFHVNGDDPEACLFVTQLALEFRMKFNRDVVIDLICYRRHGHNEADEPAATQPLLYKAIRAMQTTWALYAEKLVKEQIIAADYAAEAMKQYHARLAVGKPVVPLAQDAAPKEVIDWQPYLNQPLDQKVDTGVAKNVLVKLGEAISTVPAGFKLHPRIEKIIEARQQMTKGIIPMDWGYAETLAYASLLIEGHKVRLSGQDAERGTFFHRHAVLHNMDTGAEYTPLAHLNEKQCPFIVINSILSEEAVMGYDCGYAMSAPNDLVIWEAQFGDFANGAQVIVDQFLSSMEQKWRLNCGLTLLLPHGQEGAGPEHSSARLERYLQLCAQNNMQVCVPTTPAQVFHMLRRQVIRMARKPLIVMTPKSLLRHKLAVSSLDELTHGEYQLLIPEVEQQDKAKVTKVVLCSGKVYYDLLQKRQENKQQNIAIIRIEQLYPFPVKELAAQLASYPQVKDVVWCQEEPKNQGAWYSTKHNLEEALTAQQKLHYVGRPELAAPACGYLNTFTKEQEKLVNEALA
ncbi:MAG: 2-oxoglutarate dehydrogenase E1 component, partial [Gammaproteobacteria bacterium]|nr:2-oxoglutarate dehydrogenase E1 component [Gammaproteobacteria bacterium]